MTSKNHVHILMTTYNGAKYIRAQLDSLINQSYTNWELVIRDDGSSDNTIAIIKEYMAADRRILSLEDNLGNLRSCQSFSVLMEYVKPMADYVMFCDQDDIWLEHKIEMSLAKMKELEGRSESQIALLAYGTYKLIDDNNDLLSIPSPVFTSNPTLNLLIAESYCYGCTMIINSVLLHNASPVPTCAENHDYWVALTALATNGAIGYMQEPLLLYRQHQNNVSGSYKNAFFGNRVKRLLRNTYSITIGHRMKMLVDLNTRFKDELSADNAAVLDGYIRNVSRGGMRALFYCIRMDVHPIDHLRTISYYFGVIKGARNTGTR